MNDVNNCIDLQVEAMIKEHWKSLTKHIQDLKKENEFLKSENLKLQT